MGRPSDTDGVTVKVLSPTSKIGYYTYHRDSTWYYCARSSTLYDIPLTSRRAWAYSNKSATVRSDGRRATTYYRKVATLTSLTSPNVVTSTHRVKGESSIHGNGIVMLATPHGSPYGGAGVAVPGWITDKVIQDCAIEVNDWSANLMEDFAQAKQTIDTAAKLFNTIVKFYLMARKGNWRGLRRAFRGLGFRPRRKIANTWLMYYYGIKPLVSTLESLMDDGGPRVKTLKVRRRASAPIDPLGFVDNVLFNGIVASGKAEYRALCQMIVRINQDSSFAYWNKQGFSGNFASDALVLTWALIPYSFVLDWILPVERFLRTRLWVQGIDLTDSFLSKSQTCDATFTALNPFTGSKDSGIMPKARLRAVQFYRIHTGVTVPTSGLSLKLSLSPTNLINAAALLIQRGKG